MLKLLYKVGETAWTTETRNLEMNTTACICRNFVNNTTGDRLACNRETTRTFAPGHDARLKGFLIRAGRNGDQIKVYGNEGTFTAQAVANRFGFAHQVAEGVSRPKKTKKVVIKTVTAKVGRWFYEGTVTAGGKIFTYTDRQGRTLMAEKFTVQAA